MRRLAIAAVLALALGLGGCGIGTPEAATGDTRARFDQALHDQLPQSVRDRGTIRFVTDASYAPMEQFAADGRTIIGFEPDLAAAISQVLGIKIEMVNGAFETALDRVADGTYDAVLAAMTDTPERRKKADFVDYFSAGTSILVQHGNPHHIAIFANLCGSAVATEKGTVQADLLRSSQTGCGSRPMRIGEYRTNADALVQLRTGRAVAVLNDYPVAAYLAGEARTRNNYQLASDAQYEPRLIGIPFAKGNTRLRNAVLGALDQLIASGVYDDLLQRWGLGIGAVKAATVNGAYTT